MQTLLLLSTSIDCIDCNDCIDYNVPVCCRRCNQHWDWSPQLLTNVTVYCGKGTHIPTSHTLYPNFTTMVVPHPLQQGGPK